MTTQRTTPAFNTVCPPKVKARFGPRPLPAPELDKVYQTPVDVSVLLDILSYRRPDQSVGEMAVIRKYLYPLSPEQDEVGNMFITVGDAPSVAFTAHTDTVHSSRSQDVRQKLRMGFDGRMIGAKDGDCLGADDGTGVWILLNLIAGGVPGLYCFYRAEESGRIGSEWSAENEPERYKAIDIMLSFDRAGTTDVITHQMGERCCSEEFATRLASAIDPAGKMEPDPSGSFTDSYSFIDLIPECTNVSVGYLGQHGASESQDLTWATYLVNRLLKINFATLPVEREPGGSGDCDDLAALLATFPTEAALILEEYYGVTSDLLAADIAQEYGVTHQQLLARARDYFTPNMDGYDDAPDHLDTPTPDLLEDAAFDDEWDERPGYWNR